MSRLASLHSIPVPNGWSVEQAWEAVKRGDPIPDGEQSWANVVIDDQGRFVGVLLLEDDE